MRIACAVLGYTDQETKERFDEIVAFSEIGEFIDTPIHSYSSGMLPVSVFPLPFTLYPIFFLSMKYLPSAT